MDKPIQLLIEETKENIVSFINEECSKNNIDYYFLYVILKEIFEETAILKDRELKKLKENFLKGETKDGIRKNKLD